MEEVYFSLQEFGLTTLMLYLILIAHIMIVLKLLPPIPHNLNFRSYVQKKFHFPKLQQAWKAIGDRLLKPCYLNRDYHNYRMWTRKQRTDVGKYSFINRTINSWNQLLAGLLASFPCKLNTFRKWVKNVVTSKGLQVGIDCK